MLLLASIFAVAAASLSSQDISAAGPFGELRGTWTKGSDTTAPVVLIIPGSGPTDRNGNSPLGINAGSYRLLAEGLKAKGIATVRIDKRGMFESAGAVPDANAVTISDYVNDTRSWVKTIRSTTGTNCVWLLGHSEGGLVALATAQVEPNICGLILVATPGRPLGEVLKDQLRANPANAPILSSAEAAIDILAAGRRVNITDLPKPLAQLFNPAVQGFLISAFTVDPAEFAKRVAKPILILQGERDLQIGIPDAMALQTAAPSAKLARLPNTNHVLKTVTSDDAAANIATYSNPSLPLASGITELISDFLKPEGSSNRN
ncbi:alpha/beta hydrolase [Brucella intermedia]|uniref:alpha/beta hydrolase n=1 Tax=Brucella intermedia TaxID=94625 RepID=UPI0005B7D3AC|nr:alpha/beta fold hydrolase [Brucella intermedia]